MLFQGYRLKTGLQKVHGIHLVTRCLCQGESGAEYQSEEVELKIDLHLELLWANTWNLLAIYLLCFSTFHQDKLTEFRNKSS